MTATTVARTGGFSLTYSGLLSLTINGGSGNDLYDVVSTTVGSPLTINAGSGNNIFDVSPVAKNLSNLAAPITLNGGSGKNALDINDQDALAAKITVADPGFSDRIGSRKHSRLTSISVDGGNLGGTFSVPNTASIPMTLIGGTATNTLVGPNTDSYWTISSAGGGTVGMVNFSRLENLVGGSGVDVFKVTNGGATAGNLNGGGALLHEGNWLDYSALTARRWSLSTCSRGAPPAWQAR